MKKQERANVVLDNLNKFYPNIPIPLRHKNVYELLIAVLLSAQCTDERVNKITPLLFKTANNPHDMAKVPVNKIYKIIKPCGLAPKKSKAISKLSKILIKYLKKVPIIIDTNTIFKNLTRKISLNLNRSLFFKKINSKIELSHDEIVVAIGIIIHPILLK